MAPVVIGMANIMTILSEVDTSFVLLSESSLG